MPRELIINVLQAVFVLVVFQWEHQGSIPADGFKIYIGDSAGVYNQVVNVPDGAQRQIQADIPDWQGTKFAAMSSFNVWGESARGAEIEFGEKPSSPLNLTASPAPNPDDGE